MTTLSTAEILQRYDEGSTILTAALKGLSESDLDLVRTPGEWSIRQIVHHIADGEHLWTLASKAALAASGSPYEHHWYSTDNACALPLDYARRAIEPSLALFNALRAQTSQLLHRLPDPWERYILFERSDLPGPTKVTVEEIIEMMAGHVDAHASEILEIRQIHQR